MGPDFTKPPAVMARCWLSKTAACGAELAIPPSGCDWVGAGAGVVWAIAHCEAPSVSATTNWRPDFICRLSPALILQVFPGATLLRRLYRRMACRCREHR